MACSGMIVDLCPISIPMCWGREVLFSLAFTLTMGTLFVRSYRMYRILVFRQIKQMRVIKARVMVGLLVAIVLIDILLILLRLWLEPTSLAVVLHPSEWVYEIRCFDNTYHPLQIISTGYKALILCFGVFLAFQTRKIPFEDFNDSSAMAFCIHNTALMSIIGLPINSVLHLDQQLVLEVVVYSYLGISTILRLLGPKFRLIMIGEANRALPNNLTPSNTSMAEEPQYRDPAFLALKIQETEELLEALRSMQNRASSTLTTSPINMSRTLSTKSATVTTSPTNTTTPATTPNASSLL